MKTLILSFVLSFICTTYIRAQWIKVNMNTTNSLHEVVFSNSDNGYLDGGLGTLRITKNAGISWSAVKTDFHVIPSIFCLGDDEIYASSNGLFKSLDSGKSWTEVGEGKLSVGASIFDIFFTTKKTGFINWGHKLYKTDDSGMSWQKATDIPISNGIIMFPTQDVGYVAGGYMSLCEFGPCPPDQTYSGYVLKTTDGGKNWEQLNFFDNKLRVIAATFLTTDVGYCFINNEACSLCKTIDGGETWTKKDIDIPVRDGLFLTESVGVVISDLHEIYVTNNGGTTWWLEYTSDTDLLELGASDNVVFVAGRKGLLLRRDLSIIISENKNNIKANSEEVVLYPNPAKGTINFKFNHDRVIRTVTIKNLSGQSVYRSDKILNNVLDVKSLSNGIYFVEVSLANNEKFINKIVINN